MQLLMDALESWRSLLDRLALNNIPQKSAQLSTSTCLCCWFDFATRDGFHSPVNFPEPSRLQKLLLNYDSSDCRIYEQSNKIQVKRMNIL